MVEKKTSGVVAVKDIPTNVIVVNEKLRDEVTTLETIVQSSPIKTDTDNEEAAKVLDRLTKLIKEVEANKKAVNKPFYTVSRLISAAAKPFLDRLEEAKQSHKKNMTAYYLKREAEREEAERKAAEEAEEKSQHQSKMEAPAVLDTGGITLNVPGQEPVVTPPVVNIPKEPAPLAGVTIKAPEAKASGTKVTKKKVLSVTKGRVSEVPREYCSPDKEKIQQAYNRGEITPEIHQWLTVTEVTDISSTGR